MSTRFRLSAMMLGAGILLLGVVGVCAGEADLPAAREAVAAGKYADGLKALDAILAKPDAKTERDARALRVRALLETGVYKEAVAEAARLEALAPDDAEALVLHADALATVGSYAEAKARLAKALKADPAHLDARLLTLVIGETTGDAEAVDAQATHFFDLYAQDKAKTAKALTAVARAAESDDPKGAWRAYQAAAKADPKCIEAHVLAGFHCLSKYAWQYARQCFERALELNPNLAIAHVGMSSAAVAANRYTQAMATLDTALKTNPHLPDAHLLRAVLLAVEQKHGKSLEAIRTALAVNPHNPTALAMVAAHYEAVGNAGERDKAIAQTLTINPRFAELYATLAQASARLRRTPAAIAWARKAIELDPDYWRGYYIAGMNLLRAGEESEGYRLLDRAFALNGFNVWAFNTLTVLDRDLKRKEFAYHETPHFFVKLDKTEDAILWPYIEPLLKTMYDDLTGRYGFEPVGPKEYGKRTLVLLFPKHEEFSARTVGLPGLSALGACLGQVITMPSPRLNRMRRGNPFNWRNVLIHEFAHVVTLQKTRYHIPRWFTEGISVWEEHDTRVRWDGLLLDGLAKDRLLPLEDFDRGFTRPSFRTQVPLSYYQASLVIRHFDEAYGFDAILKMLELYREGRPTTEVLPKVTGKPMKELNAECMAYIRRYAEQIRRSPQVDPATLKKLEEEVKKDDKNAELWARIASGRLATRKVDEARKAAKRAAELDPKLPRAHTILGIIALQKDKDRAAAKGHFLKAREAAPDYFFAHLYLGLILKDEGATEQAIAELEAARKLYPRYQARGKNPHLLLAELYQKGGKPEQAIAMLRELTALDPANARAWVQLGKLLADGKRHAEAAAAYLEAIYIDPFDPEIHLAAAAVYEAAKSLDEAIREYAVAARISPGALVKLVARARAFAVAGRAEAARKAIAAIRQLDPTHAAIPQIERLLNR